jgi:cell division protein FtsZ
MINLDFADVKTIMSGMGVAMMGTGTAEGENRAMQAAQKAIASPLLEDSSVNGARGVIINVTGGPDLSLMEVNEASCVIQEAAHEDANIIFGAVVDPDLVGRVKITVIATGFDRKTSRVAAGSAAQTPVDMSRYQEYAQRVAATGGAGPVPMEPIAVEVPPVPIARRPTIDLPLRTVDGGVKPLRASVGGGADAADLDGVDAPSQFDVPAFLRRT